MPSFRNGFRTDIQGLRAIAVVAVVMYHSGVQILPGGYVGVDIFFVISGFLITSHLLRGLHDNGKVGFANFYARRARRILPASFLVLILTVTASLIWMPPLALKSVFQGAIATAVYVPNMLFAAQGTDYLSETAPSVFQHYWSLGVEEQFYLFWPALLTLAFFAFRKSERAVFWMVTGLTIVSFMLCVVLTFKLQPVAFFTLPTRAWELGAGGLVAFLLGADPLWVRGRIGAVVGWVGITGILVALLTFNSTTPFPGYAAAVPVAATALVIIGGYGRRRYGPDAVLSLAPLLFIGEISYSLYLVHWPLLVIPQAAVGQNNPLPLYVTLGLGVLSVPIAWAMYKWVENPLRDFRWLTRARAGRTLAITAAASLLIVAVSGGGLFFGDRASLDAGKSALAVAATVNPVATTYVPSNMQPSLRTAVSDNPAIYASGCHRDFASTDSSGCTFGTNLKAPKVVLFGDSHAAQWFPSLKTLADDGEIILETDTKSSCPFVSIAKNQAGIEYKACEKWRDGVIARMADVEPALIVVASDGKSDLVGGNADFNSRWEHGIEKTLKELPGTSAVVLMADTPNLGETPAVCLSAHLESTLDCGLPRDAAVNVGVHDAERQAAAATGATYIDMTNYLCDPQFCPPVVGNALIYRDAHHMTATFNATLSGVMEAELRPEL